MSAPYACVRDMTYELKTDDKNTNAPGAIHGLQYLKSASSKIAILLGIQFTPSYEIRQFDVRTWHIDSNRNWLLLPFHFFSVSQVTDGNGTSLDPSIWFTEPVGVVPAHTIQLITRSAINPFGGAALSFYTTTSPQYYGQSNAKVTGVFGWHPDYNNAWLTSLDSVQDNPLDNVSNFMKVNSVVGTDLFGRTPRFSPGQLLRVDNENMEVTAVDPISNMLTILRGQTGTTAASHLKNAIINIWEPPADIVIATARYAAYLYKRRGDFSIRNFDVSSGQATMIAKDMPGDIKQDLQMYVNGVPDGGWTLSNVW